MTNTNPPDKAANGSNGGGDPRPGSWAYFMAVTEQACGTRHNPRRGNISRLKEGLRAVGTLGARHGGGQVIGAMQVVGRGIPETWTSDKAKLAVGLAGLYARHGAGSGTPSQQWASLGSVLKAAGLARKGDPGGYALHLGRVASARTIGEALHWANRICGLGGDDAGMLDWARLGRDLEELILADNPSRKQAIELRWAKHLYCEAAEAAEAAPEPGS